MWERWTAFSRSGDAEVFFLGRGECGILDESAAGDVTNVDGAVIEGAEYEAFLAGDRVGEFVVGFFLRFWFWLFRGGIGSCRLFLLWGAALGGGFAFFVRRFHSIALCLDFLLILAGDGLAGCRFRFWLLARWAIRKLIARSQDEGCKDGKCEKKRKFHGVGDSS